MNKKIKKLIKKLGKANLETKIIAGVLAVGVLTCSGAIIYKLAQGGKDSSSNITTAANPKADEKKEEKLVEEVKKEEVAQEESKTEELAQAELNESPNRNEEVTSSNSSVSNTSSKGENSNSTPQPKVEENQQVETKKESVPEPKVEPQEPKEPESTQTLQQKFCAKYGLTPIEGTTSFALYRGCKINVSVDDDAYVREQMRLADKRIQETLENYNRNKKNHPEWFDSNGMPKPGTSTYDDYQFLKSIGINP